MSLSRTATPATHPFTVDAQPGRPPTLTIAPASEVIQWVHDNRDALRAAVTEHGALLVRGLGLSDPAQIGEVFRRLGTGLMSEKETFAQRTSYSDGVYSSTAWPPGQPMCMHHELSYTLRPPGTMLFACVSAPPEGGATGLADAAAVLHALPEELVARFDREGWMLVRRYNEDIGADIGESFGTEDLAQVEAYCRRNAIDAHWESDGTLVTTQRRRAILAHPVTGVACWFNQVAFLSEWTLDPEVREFLVDSYGPEGLPFTTKFGGGDDIGTDIVERINDVYTAHTVREPWQPGDLMVVDNVRTAHSREAFSGHRQIVVGMTDEFTSSIGPGTWSTDHTQEEDSR